MKRPPKNNLIGMMNLYGSQRAVAEYCSVQADTVRAWLRHYGLDPKSFKAKRRMPDGSVLITGYTGPKTTATPMTNADRVLICDCEGEIVARELSEKMGVSTSTIYNLWSRRRKHPEVYELWKSQPSARVVTR